MALGSGSAPLWLKDEGSELTALGFKGAEWPEHSSVSL